MSHTYVHCCHESASDLFLSSNSPKTVCRSEWEKQRKEDKCDSDASKREFWSDALRSSVCVWVGAPRKSIVCVWQNNNNNWKKEDICICAWTFRFDWLCACVFLVRECEFERQYLRAAGSPKVSSFHPWLGSTAACLQSVDSLGLEENRAYVAAILPFVRLFSTFILCL